MPSIAINADLRHCRCSALCENTKSRCRKCRDRARWYRRKAWALQSPTAPSPGLSRKK